MPQTAPTVPEELRHALRGLLLDEIANVQAELATLHDGLVRLERDGRYDVRPAPDGVNYRVRELAASTNGVPGETSEWGSLGEFERVAELLGYRTLEIEGDES